MGMPIRAFASRASASDNQLAPVRTDDPGDAPARYIYRELTVALNGGLQFFYKNPGLAQPLPAGGIDEVIADLLAPVESNFFADVGAPALETPLDLNVHGDPAFVVLQLDPTINWRFSSTEPAVSLKDGAANEFYGGLRHVLPGGVAQEAPAPGCNMVYFTVRPPLNPPNGHYRHGLNFHVELSQNISGGGTGILPLIIDPDVGHPGGSPT